MKGNELLNLHHLHLMKLFILTSELMYFTLIKSIMIILSDQFNMDSLTHNNSFLLKFSIFFISYNKETAQHQTSYRRVILLSCLTLLSCIGTMTLIFHPTSSGLTSTMTNSIFMAHLIRILNRGAWFFMYGVHFTASIIQNRNLLSLCNHLPQVKASDLKQFFGLITWHCILFVLYRMCNKYLMWMPLMNFLMQNYNNFWIIISFELFLNFVTIMKSKMKSVLSGNVRDLMELHEKSTNFFVLLSEACGPFITITYIYLLLVCVGYIYLTFFAADSKGTMMFTILYKIYLTMSIGGVAFAAFRYFKHFTETSEMVSSIH